MDYGEKSAFWKTMVKYDVDIYLAGEVHTNTVTKDPGSNLLQIVSRGNQFSNFLKVEATNSTLKVIAYNEIGVKRMNNKNYEVHGSLTVDKSECDRTISSGDDVTSSLGCTHISASGVLSMLDRTSALLHFNFDKILPLGDRQVIGLQHDDHFDTLITKSITIRGIESKEALPNLGSFGRTYIFALST